jgi:Flp pilus assembly protein TadG
MMRRKGSERGSVSVEFALLLPVFLVLIVGGVHFGRVLTTRHRLSDATGYATRAAAIRGITSAGSIRAMVIDRLGGASSDCSAINVVSNTVADGAGLTRLEVSATCTLDVGFGASLLGAIGPDTLTVSAAMPL